MLDENNDVMNNRGIAWAYLCRLHPAILREVSRDCKMLVVQYSLSRNVELDWHGEHDVGLTDLPALGEARDGRQLFRVAFGSASFDPGYDRVDLFLGEAALVVEFSVGW